MIEIKVRGKSEIFNEWLYGNLVVSDTGTCCICSPQDMEMDGHHIRQLADKPLYVDKETIGRFTGLYDKNGKEIYEGDVFVRDSNMMGSDSPYCVRYKNGSWIGVAADKSWVTLIEHADEPYRDDLYYIEVIGNIHDNPELIN